MKNSIFLILLLLQCVVAKTQTITANSSWNISIPANTITEAGNNYTTNITSPINQTLVNFSVPAGLLGANYTVSIHKVDTDWHSNLSLWAQRTGNGTSIGLFSTGSIVGGVTFLQLTNSPQTFFNGNTGILSSGRTNIPIQYEIRGISVLLPVKTYTTTIVFTVSN
jgi:hypothetical protein